MSKKVNYPKVLAAAMKGEGALWEIGDALIEAVGPPSQNGVHDQSYTKLKPIVAELFDHGIEQYDEKHLSRLRVTAHTFPSPHRVRGVSWTAHYEARNPENLKAVLAAAKAAGRKTISKRYIIQVRDGMYLDAKLKRKRLYEIAVKKRAAAEAEREQAAAQKRAAKDEAARKAAEAREEAAVAKAKRNAERASRLSGPPTPKATMEAPDPTDISMMGMMLVKLQFHRDSSEAKRMVKRMDQEISPHIDDLSKEFIVSSVEDLLEIAELYRKLAAKLNRNQVNKRAHLHAVSPTPDTPLPTLA